MKRLSQVLLTILSTILLLCVLGFAVSCSEKKPTGDGGDTTAQIVLNRYEINAIIGEKTVLKAKNDYLFDSITWQSENESVAIVSDKGIVEAYGVGTTKIKAIVSNDNVAECVITVGMGNTLPQIVIENECAEYKIGKSAQSFPFNVYVLFNGNRFYDVNVEYKSSNEEVLTIDSDNNSFIINTVGQTQVSLNATWRGISFADVPALYKIVNVSVVDEVYFYVNDKQFADLTLYTVDNFYGKDYVSQMPFVPTISINGQTSDDVTVSLPNTLVMDGENIVADNYGTGKIILSHQASDGTVYSQAIDVSVLRPEATHTRNLKYFSSFTGTFKDEDADFQNKSIVQEIFGTTEVEGIKAYQGKKELTVSDGKILGVNNPTSDKYNATIRLETDDVVCYVNMSVYTLVIQSAEDLEYFDLEILKSDDPATPGYDETEVTLIDGYCELINNIDATGIKLTHSALNTTYDMVDEDGNVKQVGIKSDRYGIPGGLRRYGFCGVFNGKGYTISNLDTSVAEGVIGGGLFGYILGGAVIKDVAFTNMNISNSSGLTYGLRVPTPVGGFDELGTKRAYTEFRNIYISLSTDTVNPKGAILYAVHDAWNGLYDFTNIIIDARGVEIKNSTSGGVLTNDGVMLYREGGYKTKQNVFVISDEYPISFNSSLCVFGQNEANGKVLDALVGTEAYASNIFGYKSFDELASDKKDYSSFSSSWSISNYPIFKTAHEVLPSLNDQMIYDKRLILNSTANAKSLKLIEVSSGEEIAFTIDSYDQTKITVDTDGALKLANDVLSEESTSLVISYHYKDKDLTMELVVRLLPSLITVDEEFIMTTVDGNFDTGDTFESGESILSAWQIDGQNERELTVDNGNIKDVKVKIKTDYSDVDYVTIKVRTNVTDYLFTAIKAYSKIIKTANDLKILQRSNSVEKTTGYYILGNNINADGFTIQHSGIKLGDTNNVFQGVFDGRGYTIKGFKPGEYGLFGAIYSDEEENGGRTVIKNLGLTHVQSEADKNFTIFGYYLDSSAEGIINEITNVHVQIDKTHSCYNYTSNYRGLFLSNSSERNGGIFNNYKMTNVLVEVSEEVFNGVVELSFGTIMSRDHLIGLHTSQERSARFDNVVTISRASPIVYRQTVDGEYATQWGIHMYFVYAENEVGKVGLGYKETQGSTEAKYQHNPVKEDGAKGSYILNNVYRYDNISEVDSEKVDTFIETGLWKIIDGKLSWAKAPLKAEATEDNGNFNPDWLDKIQ